MNSYLFERSADTLYYKSIETQRKIRHYEEMKKAFGLEYVNYLKSLGNKYTYDADLHLYFCTEKIFDFDSLFKNHEKMPHDKIINALNTSGIKIPCQMLPTLIRKNFDELAEKYIDWSTINQWVNQDKKETHELTAKSLHYASTHQTLDEKAIGFILDRFADCPQLDQIGYHFYLRTPIISHYDNLSYFTSQIKVSDLEGFMSRADNKSRMFKTIVDMNKPEFDAWLSQVQDITLSMDDLVDYALNRNPHLERFVRDTPIDYSNLLLALKIAEKKEAIEFINSEFSFPEYCYEILSSMFNLRPDELEKLRLSAQIKTSVEPKRFKI